jgi:hypothetical protein
LCGTAITDDGLANVAPLTDLKWLHLADTRVTDGGLKYLTGLTNLKQLFLPATTAVTPAGVDELKTRLPGVTITVEAAQAIQPPPQGGQGSAPKQTVAEKRKRLEAERAALEGSIRSLENEIEKALNNARELDSLARQALNAKPPMYSSAAAYQAQASQFRQLASELRGNIAQAHQRIREINAELARL